MLCCAKHDGRFCIYTALYAPDSARANDNEASWPVLVPRTNWAGRAPSRTRFEVNKQTSQVSSQPVK